MPGTVKPCTCGHNKGIHTQHYSNKTKETIYGICNVPGCNCELYQWKKFPPVKPPKLAKPKLSGPAPPSWSTATIECEVRLEKLTAVLEIKFRDKIKYVEIDLSDWTDLTKGVF